MRILTAWIYSFPLLYCYNIVLPFFVTKPRNQTVLEKGTTAFYCNANGHPLPNITWVKDGVTVGNGSTLRFETTWRRLSGRYWCHAQNGLSVAINASAFLNVQCKYLTYPGLKPTSILQCNATGLFAHFQGRGGWTVSKLGFETRGSSVTWLGYFIVLLGRIFTLVVLLSPGA